MPGTGWLDKMKEDLNAYITVSNISRLVVMQAGLLYISVYYNFFVPKLSLIYT